MAIAEDTKSHGCPSEASYACYTPEESVYSETMPQPTAKHEEFPPQEGKTFVIQSHDHRHLILDLSENRLQAVSADKAGLGVAWRCIKTNNWYGFINTVSGGRLGYDEKMKFRMSPTSYMHKTGATKSWSNFDYFNISGYWRRDDEEKILASFSQHYPWEWFTIDRHKKGGYVLQVTDGVFLYQMAIADDGSSLVAVKEGGTAWDFFEVKTTGIPYRL